MITVRGPRQVLGNRKLLSLLLSLLPQLCWISSSSPPTRWHPVAGAIVRHLVVYFNVNQSASHPVLALVCVFLLGTTPGSVSDYATSVPALLLLMHNYSGDSNWGTSCSNVHNS